jgi:hypothetical protein
MEGLEVASALGLHISHLCHGERRRKAREEVTIVLAIGHALRAQKALSRPDALSGFLEVVHRLIEDGVFVSHDQSIRVGIVRSPDCFAFSREHGDAELLQVSATCSSYRCLVYSMCRSIRLWAM